MSVNKHKSTEQREHEPKLQLQRVAIERPPEQPERRNESDQRTECPHCPKNGVASAWQILRVEESHQENDEDDESKNPERNHLSPQRLRPKDLSHSALRYKIERAHFVATADVHSNISATTARPRSNAVVSGRTAARLAKNGYGASQVLAPPPICCHAQFTSECPSTARPISQLSRPALATCCWMLSA